MVRIVYFYFMKNVPQQIAATAPEHAAYWHTQGLTDYSGGPFQDRCGGLITFSADSLSHARHLVSEDPFIQANVLEQFWVKVWQTE
jgi:uncharacterized protein YciI